MVSLLLVGICWAHSCGFIQLVARLAWKVLKGLGANCGLNYFSSSSGDPSLPTGEPELLYRMVSSKRERSGRTRPSGQVLIKPLLGSMSIGQSKSHGQTQNQCGKGSLRGEGPGRYDQWGSRVTLYHILLCGRVIDSLRELDRNAPDGGDSKLNVCT